MSLFDKLRRKSAKNRQHDEAHYEQALDELESGVVNRGVWAKALANCDGDEAKAKSLYIKLRVESIEDNLVLAEEALEEALDKMASFIDSVNQYRYSGVNNQINESKILKKLMAKGYEISDTPNGRYRIDTPTGNFVHFSTFDQLIAYAKKEI